MSDCEREKQWLALVRMRCALSILQRERKHFVKVAGNYTSIHRWTTARQAQTHCDMHMLQRQGAIALSPYVQTCSVIRVRPCFLFFERFVTRSSEVLLAICGLRFSARSLSIRRVRLTTLSGRPSPKGTDSSRSVAVVRRLASHAATARAMWPSPRMGSIFWIDFIMAGHSREYRFHVDRAERSCTRYLVCKSRGFHFRANSVDETVAPE